VGLEPVVLLLPGGASVSGTEPVLPDPGTSGKVAGYQLGERIGESDVAVVRLARDERLDRKVAVKILAPELAGDAAFRARLLSESRAAAALGHPHIVPVYAAGDACGILYVAMRHVGGGDARSLLSRLGPLPLALAWSVIAQVASALDAAHGHGLIHRDVKPANVLLEAAGGAGASTPDQADGYGHVYLSDFGMGRDTSPGEIIAAGQSAGALDYLAPEQIQGRALDGRADLYSLACAGYELLCGAPPFGEHQGLTVMYAQLYAPPPPATARRPDLPAAVDLVLATALAKDPADRYPTCGQFAEELRTALGLPPDGPAETAGLDSHGRARPAPASRPASSRDRPAGKRESGPEPARTPAPVPPGPGRPRSREDEPAAGPGQMSHDSVSGPGRPSRRRLRSGVIGFVLALAAAGIAAAVTILVVGPARPAADRPTPSPATTTARPPASSPAPSPSSVSTLALASRQAAAVSDLLNSSAATRKALQGAVTEARDCTNLPGAVRQIQDATNQRSTEYSQASALSTSALADGTIVKADLTAALRSSLDADRDYLAWAQRQLKLGCAAAAQSSAFNAAYTADERANAAKEAFVQVWNPVAARYGIREESPGSI
jgi:serine/threonine protein kinase